MNVQQAIRSRRAVRSFDHLAVTPEVIGTLLHAAVQAPSAMNAQPLAFAIVQDRARLQRYSDGAKRLLLAEPVASQHDETVHLLARGDAFNVFYDAGTLIAICVRGHDPYGEADAWLAAENLMLAACDLGLGTCCVSSAASILNTRVVRAELAIPSDTVVVAPIIVGYPGASTPAPARAAPNILSWLRDPSRHRD